MQSTLVSLLSYSWCHRGRIFLPFLCFCLYSEPAQDLAIVGTLYIYVSWMSAAGSDTLLSKHNKHYTYTPYCLQAANWVILLSQVSTTPTPKPHLIEISDKLQKTELYESLYRLSVCQEDKPIPIENLHSMAHHSNTFVPNQSPPSFTIVHTSSLPTWICFLSQTWLQTLSLMVPWDPQILNSDFYRILFFFFPSLGLSLKVPTLKTKAKIYFTFLNMLYILHFILFIRNAKG